MMRFTLPENLHAVLINLPSENSFRIATELKVIYNVCSHKSFIFWQAHGNINGTGRGMSLQRMSLLAIRKKVHGRVDHVIRRQ